MSPLLPHWIKRRHHLHEIAHPVVRLRQQQVIRDLGYQLDTQDLLQGGRRVGVILLSRYTCANSRNISRLAISDSPRAVSAWLVIFYGLVYSTLLDEVAARWRPALDLA